jgi:hypothetical protein
MKPARQPRCCPCMRHDPEIRALARTLIGKHGREARNVAHKKAEESLARQDYEVAATWCSTAHALRTMGAPPRQKPSPEPPLADLLDDPATHAVMKRDKLGRRDVERVIKAAQKKTPRR